MAVRTLDDLDRTLSYEPSLIKLQRYEMVLIHASPLLMHNTTLMNPTDPITREYKKLTAKRNKTDEDYENIAKQEWYASMYYDAKLGPYVPLANLHACFREGAKKTKQGQVIRRALMVCSTDNPLGYTGPRSQDDMWNSGQFRDTRPARVERAGVMRTRPLFREWTLPFQFDLSEDLINPEDVRRIAETAGRLEGLGDYRPEYGRFNVVSMKPV